MVIRGREIPRALALLVWVIVWELLGRADVIAILPPFSKVMMTIPAIIRLSTFRHDVLLTLKAFGVGLGLSICIGVPLGFAMGRIRRIDEMLSMWVNIFISAPLTALVPVIMVLFGIGENTIVVTIILFSVWVIILDTQTGVKNIKKSLLDMARSFGANRAELYCKVIVWAALPEILTGLRMAILQAVRGVIVGQILIAVFGLGQYFLYYSQNFLMERFFALLLFVLAFAWGFTELIGIVERRVEHFAKGR